jgi:predicted RNA-binding Zn ribbon-like protein
MQHSAHTPHPSTHEHDVGIDDTFAFLNTNDRVAGEPVDRLATLRDAIDWFAQRELIHAETVDPGDERALERVRSVRAALREIADAVAEDRAPRADALDEVNRALRARASTELVATAEGCGVGHRHVGDPIDDALARIADPLVNELASGRPDRIRVCANDRCRWVFYDESRTGRRRWCDMAICGNRAKAARHRARRKGATADGDAA